MTKTKETCEDCPTTIEMGFIRKAIYAICSLAFAMIIQGFWLDSYGRAAAGEKINIRHEEQIANIQKIQEKQTEILEKISNKLSDLERRQADSEIYQKNRGKD